MKRFGLILFAFLNILMFQGCKEEIDESNLYTFTGETIEDYLVNRSDKFSAFNYILARIGYDKILAGYGCYTCFAPTNDAVNFYVDSLYNDMTNKDFPHNGMTAPGLEGLNDSLCKDIALFHLLNVGVMSTAMGNGMTVKTMLGRDINTSFDTTTKRVAINRTAQITVLDQELQNGYLHEINHVITRSNMLISGEMESHPQEYSVFSDALKATGLADSLTAVMRTEFDDIEDRKGFYKPERCELGYTIFAETDDVLAANGITDLQSLANYAKNAYENCAEWYDYVRQHNIKISTGSDYKNPWNVLSMFVRYHILKFKVPYDKLTNSHNQTGVATLVEYYETMLPYTLIKITKNDKLRINRWDANNSLTDQVAKPNALGPGLGSKGMHTNKVVGVALKGSNGQVAANNGYIHPILDMLVYNKDVPQGALNERLRFDDAALFGEMMSNSFRRISDKEVDALNGGKKGTDGDLSGSYICIPNRFFDNMVIYNGADTRLYYLSGQSSGWSNYQGDEFNCKGQYDFAMRLPPVPEGTYELRVGYTAEVARGMLQFYMGRSSDRSTMMALDIPLDMRIIPGEYPVSRTLSADNPCVYTGWCDWTTLDDSGVETDANMRNMGYMRGPLYYTVGVGTTNYARNNKKDLRRIITKQKFEQGEYWLRFKSVIENSAAQFHLDYIEFCPENVYNNVTYAEDMF